MHVISISQLLMLCTCKYASVANGKMHVINVKRTGLELRRLVPALLFLPFSFTPPCISIIITSFLEYYFALYFIGKIKDQDGNSFRSVMKTLRMYEALGYGGIRLRTQHSL